nr:salicylic acid-binding protein 2-like [Tanacetum cinerariifolium]
IQQIPTFYDYNTPLLDFMASIPPEEKVILVGHSLGGMNISLAMENFPKKISVAIFLTAIMPDTIHKPSYVLEQSAKRTPQDTWLDTQFLPYSDQQSEDLSNAKQFTEEGYGSVRRVFVLCDEDETIKEDFQRWMIDNSPVVEVKELKGVDHMPMFCDPKQLTVCLLDITLKYC